jgi:ATP-binding cassette subfamily F protein 3
MNLRIKKSKEHLGDIDYYLEQRKVDDFRSIEKKDKTPNSKKKTKKNDSLNQSIKKKINNIESKISKLEKDISVIDIALENDYEQTIAESNFFSKYENMKNELGDLMKKWEDLTIKLE